MRKRVTIGVAIVATIAALAGPAGAQIVPSKPITLVVPYPAGASTDTIMRLLVQKITERNGQRFVVENRGGGGGIPAAVGVKQSAADGYTLFQANLSHILLQAMTANLPFDLAADFQAITALWRMPYLLVVPAGSPARSVADLIQLAKTKPGGLNYATPGVGTGPQLLSEMMKVRWGGAWVHVPYRGAGPALIDLLAERVDLMFVSYASIGEFVRDGRLRILANASATRTVVPNNVPTMAEAGFPDMELDSWFGLVAPKNTPSSVVQQLRDDFVRATQDPAFAKNMSEQGVEIVGNTPTEFDKMIAADTVRTRKLAATAGMVAQ